MKKASKYDNMFDKMREVLIEYATAKDEQGRWLHKTPEIMRKFGFGDDPKVIDGFNRWLNRQGIYRCPKPKRTTPSDELFPDADVYPATELDADDGGLQEEAAKDIGIYVNIEASALMDALDKVHAACAVLQDLIGKTLDDPAYGRS